MLRKITDNKVRRTLVIHAPTPAKKDPKLLVKQGKIRKKKVILEDKPLGTGTSENYLENLTGGQIQEILDKLIIEAISPIIRITSAFDVQITHLLSMTTRNKKRKLSALDREEFINLLCQYLCTEDPEKKIRLLAESHVERGFIYNFVKKFLAHTDGYELLYQKYLTSSGTEKQRYYLKLRAIEKSVGAKEDRLLNVRYQVRDYLELVYRFRNSIVEQYVKFAYKQAKVFTIQKGENFSFDDVYQNFLTAVTKAVDKYDCSKGALTSYIQYWIMNAQSTASDHGHEYNIAYEIPQLQKKSIATNRVNNEGNCAIDVNFSVSLDKPINDSDDTTIAETIRSEVTVEETLERKQELDELRYLIKIADIRGLARLYLDIEEVFFKKEFKKMRMIMIEQKTLSEEKS